MFEDSEDKPTSEEYKYAEKFPQVLPHFLDRRLAIVLPEVYRLKSQDPQIYKFIMEHVEKDLCAFMSFGGKGYPYHIAKNLIVEHVLQEPETAVPEVDAWLGVWYNGWKLRTKIVTPEEYANKEIEYDNQVKAVSEKLALPAEENVLVPLVFFASISEAALEALIREKEYSATHIIAKEVVMYVLKTQRSKFTEDIPLSIQIGLLNAILTRAKEVAHMQGALVYIKRK